MFLFRKKHTSIRHVLVHQCGKVGSSTLVSTIRASAPALNVLQVHFITGHYLRQFRDMIGLPDTPPDFAGSTEKLLRDAEKAREILRDEDPREICVISGFRDPLDRAVSAWAQNFRHFYPELTYADANRAGELAFLRDDFERLFDAATGPAGRNDFRSRQGEWLLIDSSLLWFEREFCPAHGLKEQAIAPGNRGVRSFRHKGSLFLLYRFEALRNDMERLVRMLPLEEYRKVDKNVSSAKPYGALLADFRGIFRPRGDIWDYYYGSHYFQTFYPGAQARYPKALKD